MLHIRFTDTAEAIQFEATDFHVRIPTYREEFRQTEVIFDNIISAEQRHAATKLCKKCRQDALRVG